MMSRLFCGSVLLITAVGVAQSQQTAPPAQQSADKLYDAASKGDKTALQRLRVLAEQGDAEAQFKLGGMYFNGEGAPSDKALGLAWLRKAAERGNAEAPYWLSVFYAVGGDGVPKDAAQALYWLRISAERGYLDAQSELGQEYELGFGVPRDLAQALNWYRKAAEQGDARAQKALASMYRDGRGVPNNDSVEAVKWYRKAAEQGNADAQTELGEMYNQGDGVPRDSAQAAVWYRKAAAQGDAVAQSRLAVMDNKTIVPMLQEGGVYKVRVLINGRLTLSFIVDSGAADVGIPADVVTTLMRTGTIAQSDFIGSRTYTLADGSTTSSRTFRIRSLGVGDTVLQDVIGSVANEKGDLLLGQSFLGRFKSWSIDNATHALVLQQ
ncbi:MAG TPA: retroviral-like aspartic protease family protein [Bryobacteraceae bacterium]|nr:retroviral-like aspartic protease family protein [Bryobacteraceae bacterium]